MQHSESGTVYGTTWNNTYKVHMVNTSLVPRPYEKWPGNFCEFTLYMDVTSQQLIQAVNIGLVHVILPTVRVWLS